MTEWGPGRPGPHHFLLRFVIPAKRPTAHHIAQAISSGTDGQS